MATRALDAMTILSALEALDHELQATRWKPQNPTQRELFAWLSTYKEQLARITGLEAKASRFYEELNAFLANRGFRLSIATFDSTRELGVVSVLDKLVRWRNGLGTLSDIATRRVLNLVAVELFVLLVKRVGASDRSSACQIEVGTTEITGVR